MSGEVMQTLDIAGDSCGEDTEDEVDSGPQPWGWLFPQTKGFVSQGKLILFNAQQAKLLSSVPVLFLHCQ